MKILFAALLAAASSGPNMQSAWRCDFQKQLSCGGKNCKSASAPKNLWVFVAPMDGFYRRCETPEFSQCASLQAKIGQDGDALTIDAPDASISARIDRKLKLTETVVGANGSVISYGKCTAAPPPLVRTQ